MINHAVRAGRCPIEFIQALINLGAGFNSNLSGIDNIYNAGTLMGMKAQDISNRMEEFIDCPIGTYSTGMKARLGFRSP